MWRRLTDRLLTPSKITAWLDCAHFLTLRNQVDDGTRVVEFQPFGSFAQLLMDKGGLHESACLSEYRRLGRSVLEVPPRESGESFANWVDRVGNPFDLDYDVIYQMPFVHDGVRGVADFLVRAEDPESGCCPYEPVDAKLARAAAKPGHVLQLCFYAEALEATTGLAPKNMHVWLGSDRIESLRTSQFRPYWNRLCTELGSLLTDDSSVEDTFPEPCNHCEFCEFAEVCNQEWRDTDSLVFVASIRGTDRIGLQSSGVETLAELAGCDFPVESMQPDRLQRLVGQAALQVQARLDPDSPPPDRIIEPGEDPTWGHGFELMPEPDEGDVFLDFEGDPFWRPDAGLFFLFGLIVRSPEGDWGYKAFWAHDRDQEATATQDLIEFLEAHRGAHPGMHVFHYNHTERSALEHLAADHGVGEAALATLIETGLFVDLFAVVRNAVQVGTESYGLKSLERLAGYERSHDIDQGAGAVVEYERYMADHQQESLDRIAAYNEDDVRATLALRDWLVGLRPDAVDWRAPYLEADEGYPELDALVAALQVFEAGTPERLLGDLLGYWLRERRACTAPKVAKTGLDTPDLLDDPEAIAELELLGTEVPMGRKGKALTPVARFRWPKQEVSDKFGEQPASTVYGTTGGPTGYASIVDFDADQRELVLRWGERCQELGTFPSVVIRDTWVPAKPKPQCLGELAERVLAPNPLGAPNADSMALLGRDIPTFVPGRGPIGGRFTDDLGGIKEWIRYLDHSYVAIQGPPGTGKTFRGAHIVHRLICDGLRVGITAISHNAIDNLLGEIVRVFEELGDSHLLRAVRRGAKPPTGALPGVDYAKDNPPCAKPGYNLIAGTTWLFSGPHMRGALVDVLIVDEAGQLALADAVAASTSSQNLVLLGDPLQLPQVSRATHPGGAGNSVLEHILGADVTMPPDRGVFLTETRRMHPDICRFISEQIYEGRLRSHPSCAIQTTALGTGLRWLRVEHAGCSTESPEEAAVVAQQISQIVGNEWIDQKGHKAPLQAKDIMVVAPYNDQVNLLRSELDSNGSTRGVRVGTVDKFQGQQAPVVFFTMATSSAEDMPRGPEFLFSRNRLNVAISRAQCLAYLVCTEELLNSRAHTVEDMRLISTLCAFVEYCTP